MTKNIFNRKFTVAFAVILLQFVSFNLYARESTLTGKSATEITAMMNKGWNMGNTFDATGGNKDNIYSHETSWGNPKVTKELIEGVKAAGFSTIRIPITWENYIDKNNNYEIYPEYMARIKEVVDYAYDAGLFIIVNVHHEGWVNRKDLDKSYEDIGKELAAVWKQISNTFADYDQYLIFEGMNEPRAQGTSYEWNGTLACYDAINYLNQVFVETVRKNAKGYNNERMLMIPGYAASSSASVLKTIKLPEINGKTVSNLCVAVHCYSPYNFCLSDNQTTFDPKKSGDTIDITSLFSTLKSLFLDKGIPVVMGECGATNSGNNNSARLAWFAFMGAIASEYGVPAIVWDNGYNGKSGGECHNYFNRKTGEASSQDLIDAFISGSINIRAENVSINFDAIKNGKTSTLINPADVGFSTKLYTQMKVNHTEGNPMGFSLRVDSDAPDFNAEYNIRRFGGHTIRIGAWLYSENKAAVSAGIKTNTTTEIVSTTAGTEWSQVLFDVEVPEGSECVLYFKGNAKFFIDDFSIEMDPAEPLPQIKNKGNTSTVLLIIIIVAVIAVVAAAGIVVFKKVLNKKN